MDPSPPLLPPLSDSQPENLDSSENSLSAYTSRTEIVSDLKQPVSSIDPLLAPKFFSQESSTDSDSLNPLKPLTSTCDLSGCFSLSSESAPHVFNTQASDFMVYSYFASSEPILPLFDKPPPLSRDLTSCPSESLSLPPQAFSDFHTEHDPDLSYSFIQDSLTNQSFGAISPISGSLMEQSATKSGSHHWSCEQNLFRSLSHGSETEAAPESLSELFIFESETQEFIPSPQNPILDPQEIKCPNFLSSSQTGKKEADPDPDTHALMCDSAEVMTQCYHSFSEEGDRATKDSESGVRRPSVNANEMSVMSGNDVKGGKADFSGLTSQERQSDSPDELWLDACQYLAVEDAVCRDVLEKTGCFVMEGGLSATSDLSFPQSDTKVFGYSPDEGDRIGCSSDDTGGWGPPVERWSSVDSWASALSDWAGIIAAPSEDFATAFTEIGAEIDALTQALVEAETHLDSVTERPEETDKPAEVLIEGEGQETSEVQAQPTMAIQDQLLQEQVIPESSIHSGKTCLPEATGLSATSELQDTNTTQSEDSCVSTQGEKEPGEILSSQAVCAPAPTHQHSSVGSSCTTVASPGGVTAVTVIPESSSSSAVLDEITTDLHLCGGYVDAMEADIYISKEEEPIILNITEDTDFEKENASGQLIKEEAFGDGVYKVIEELSVSQPGQEGKRSCGPAQIDPGFSGSEADTPSADREATEGTKPPPDLHFLNTHVPDTQPGLYTNVHTHVLSDTSLDLDGTCQVEPQLGSPQFIMPVAPLSIGSSPVCGTRNTLDGDHTCAKRFLNDSRDLSDDHVQPQVTWPIFDGINNKLPLTGKEEELLIDKKENIDSGEKSSPNEQPGQLDHGLIISDFYTGDTVSVVTDQTTSAITDLSRELPDLIIVPADHCFISHKDRVACITLDLRDPLVPRAKKPIATAAKTDQTAEQETTLKMPHKSHKTTSECNKSRSKKDKSAGHHHGVQISKKQENLCHLAPTEQACKIQDTHPVPGETIQDARAGFEDKEAKLGTMTENVVATEKVPTKPHGKKKKKHNQTAAAAKSGAEPSAEIENGAKPKTTKGRIDMFEAKLGAKAGKTQTDSNEMESAKKKSQQPEDKVSQGEQTLHHVDHKDHKPANFPSPLNDDVIKRRRLSENKFGKIVSAMESKLAKPQVSLQAKVEEPKLDVEVTRRKAYSEVVKQKTITPQEEPKVVQPIQAVSVSGDPQSLCLWCQFTAVFTDYTVTWSREGAVLAELKRSAGDESRVSFIISSASHKDLGKYQCRLSSLNRSVILDYLLTYEVLSEIVIPVSPKTISPALVEVASEEEDVSCSRLMFREDFLSDQYFEENHPASIITEKVHFGEGMHRRAFRTKLQAGLAPLFVPGLSCVLKVHNAISYGTKNNDELIQKNFSLAVEECQVQNTAREYIKAYTAVAQSIDAFGEVPEIIPIYLVHRPSNDIPYATLEEELIGNFVKYSVKDGKEINLMRCDSESGQKCCAFQHWVYHKTDGNLLVTDMQGVGMKLTDVGIATCKKGYKGFKGNCATSFIDQFKALHQCNKYCEILGLTSLQPKPKKPAAAPKTKPPPSAAPKKKTFGPTIKSKS